MSDFEANVFEDDNGIRRESGFLRRITQLQVVRDGGFLPDGYGICWTRWNSAEFICAPMPWHIVIGAAYRAYHMFRRGFGLPTELETAAYNKGRADATSQPRLGYNDGYQAGYTAALDNLARQLDAQQKDS